MDENSHLNIQTNQQPEPVGMKSGFDISKYILPGAILIAAILVSGSILYSTRNRPNSPMTATISAQDIKTNGAPLLGKDNASVTIIEFSDFQCPFCRSFWSDTLPQIKSQYIDTGKVKLFYKYFPLSFHPQAEISAQAGACANDQGKFWEMHDKMFSEQAKKGTGTVLFSVDDIKSWALQIGLNPATFNNCLDSKKYAQKVTDDYNEGTAAGVTGTPSFFINGQLIIGAQPFSVFKQAIDSALKK